MSIQGLRGFVWVKTWISSVRGAYIQGVWFDFGEPKSWQNLPLAGLGQRGQLIGAYAFPGLSLLARIGAHPTAHRFAVTR